MALALTFNYSSAYKKASMSEFTAALGLELQRLKTELQQDPRFKRLTQIEQLLAEYRGDAAPTPAVQTGRHHHLTAADLNVGSPLVSGSPRLYARASVVTFSKATKVRLALFRELLRERGSLHRSEMLKHLINQNRLHGD